MEKYLEDLIQFKTTHETGNSREFDRLYNYVNRELSGLSLAAEKFVSNKQTSWLFATNATPKILLATHVDVVPGQEEQFMAKVNKDKIIGRGAIDMKFALAVFMTLLQEQKSLSNLSIGLLLTSDEEIGGVDGTQYVLEKTNLHPDCVLLPDGGRDMAIEHAEKGFWHVRITAHGKSAHGSRPWLGDNAIDKLLHVYSFLQKMYPTPTNNKWVTTINAGRIKGGTAINIIPDEAYFDLDIRYTDSETKNKIHSILQKFEDMGISIETHIEGSPYYLPVSNQYLTKYQSIAKKVSNVSPNLIKSAGSSDARYYADKNIPVIISGPIGNGLHTNHEWVNIPSLYNYKKTIEEFILATAV